MESGFSAGNVGGEGGVEREEEAHVTVEDDETMELIYDPNLGLYFDPQTNQFFMRDAVG